MQLRKLAIVLGVCAISSPVWAQQSAGVSSSAAGSAMFGANGVNETTGSSGAGINAQGSGSADLNANRPGSRNRATAMDRADQRRSDRAVSRSRAGTLDHGRSNDFSTGNRVSGSATSTSRGGVNESTAGTGATAGAGVNTGIGVGVGGLGVGVGAGANVGAGAGGSAGSASGTH